MATIQYFDQVEEQMSLINHVLFSKSFSVIYNTRVLAWGSHQQSWMVANNEFKKGVGIDSTIKSTETRILLAQFSLQKFNPYFWLIIIKYIST